MINILKVNYKLVFVPLLDDCAVERSIFLNELQQVVVIAWNNIQLVLPRKDQVN